MFEMIITLNWEHNTQPLADYSSPDYLSSLISCGFLPDLPWPSHPEQNRSHFLAFLYRDPSSPSAYDSFPPPLWTLSIGQSVSHPLGLGPCPLKVFPGVWHFDFIAILMFWVLVALGCFPSPTTNSPNLWPPTTCPIILLGSDTNYLEFTSDSTSYRTQFHNTVLTLGVNHESWATCPSAWPAVSWGFPELTHQIG